MKKASFPVAQRQKLVTCGTRAPLEHNQYLSFKSNFGLNIELRSCTFHTVLYCVPLILYSFGLYSIYWLFHDWEEHLGHFHSINQRLFQNNWSSFLLYIHISLQTPEIITCTTCAFHIHVQSTVRKKMATGTFTYNALGTKTLKERIKTQRKLVSHANSTRAMLLV